LSIIRPNGLNVKKIPEKSPLHGVLYPAKRNSEKNSNNIVNQAL